jgi:hypothetical protein
MKARPTFISNLKHLNPQNVAAEIFTVSVLLALLAFYAMQTMRHRRQQALEHSKLAAIVESIVRCHRFQRPVRRGDQLEQGGRKHLWLHRP